MVHRQPELIPVRVHERPHVVDGAFLSQATSDGRGRCKEPPFHDPIARFTRLSTWISW